jgi:hypothetical protein
MFGNILSIFMMLAIAFPVTGGVSAQELNPHFVIFPEWEWFDGLDWPEGATVSINVEGKPECSLQRLSPGNFFNGGFPAGCDVASSDIVTFTDGQTNRTHTVRNLDVTGLDQVHDTVSGLADAGAGVYVWPFATGEQQFVVADSAGNWQADFSGIFDLTPGEWGRSEIRDEAGNATAVDWSVPNPRIVASITYNWLRVDEFPPAESLNLQIYDTQDGALLWSMELMTDDSGTVFVGEWEQPVDLVPGTYITVTGASATKGLVLEALTLDVFDPAADYLAGTAPIAPEGRFVWAGTGSQTASCGMGVTADPASGLWEADFTTQPCDVTEDMWAFAQIFDADGDVSEAGPPPPGPNPHFSAFPEWESIEGWEWPQDVNVHLKIDDPATQANPDFEQDQSVVVTPWDPNGWWVNFNFGGQYDLKVGDVVTLTDGATTRTHIVRNLAISSADKDTDVVSGTADADAQIYVWPHATGQELLATADSGGNWQADFTGVYDLVPGEGGRAESRDEAGNATAVDWRIPYPHFSVFPVWEYVEGYEWPAGATVTASIEGTPECVTEGVANYPEWDPWNTFVSMNFPETCDIQAGEVVTLTDGETTRIHTVQNLAITGANATEDTVSGAADEGVLITVWPHATGEQLQATADSSGMWQVDFTGRFDLVPGAGGRSEIRDEAGNATAVDWYVPNPHIVASITENWFYFVDFAPDALLNISVYTSQGGAQVWAGTATTDSSGFVWVDAEERWDVEPGTYLVVSDGSSTKDLVVEGFTFDLFDTVQGLLKGTAPAPLGRRVWVGIGWGNDSWTMDVTTGKKGAWTADFAAPVPNGYDWVAAQIFDSDGDASELRPAYTIDRAATAGNFYVEWSTTNPEEIVDLRWNNSVNLTNTFAYSDSACPQNLEYFGNSWVSENEGTDSFFFASLVGSGMTGTWKEQTSKKIKISSISSGCPGSADVPINTNYRFFKDERRANLMVVERMFNFGSSAYPHDIRPFIPRLYPSDGFTQVLHPDASGTTLVAEGTCDFGCAAASWDGSWFAIHNPATGMGMIVQRKPSAYAAALWLDDDDASFTNSSSILLLQPAGGFTGTVTETEYLCFYDSNIWTPSLTLPEGCRP